MSKIKASKKREECHFKRTGKGSKNNAKIIWKEARVEAFFSPTKMGSVNMFAALSPVMSSKSFWISLESVYKKAKMIGKIKGEMCAES